MLAASFHQHGSAKMLPKHKRGDVAADRRADRRKLVRRKPKLPKAVQRPQNSRCVRTAAAKPAADRNPLLDAHARANPRPGRIRARDTQRMRGTNREVPFAVAGVRPDGAVCGWLYFNDVRKLNRHHDRPKLVIAVRTPAVDLEREVDLGVCLYSHFSSAIAALTLAKSVASFAFGTVENARRMSPDSTIVPVEYFSTSRRLTFSASTPIGFTHMK